MPLGAPIGSGRGLATKDMIQIIIKESKVPVIVDAGIRSPSEAAESMELGCEAVLINSAIAAAEEVEKLCGEIPASLFRDSRDIILVFTASALSFLLNDVVNSSGDPDESIYWPSVVMMAAPFVSVVAIKLYKWKTRDVPPKREQPKTPHH